MKPAMQKLKAYFKKKGDEMSYTFDRYVDGELRAMGIRIEECKSLSGARKKAYRLNAQLNPEDKNLKLKLRKERP